MIEELERQEKIASCMSAAGFDYTPIAITPTRLSAVSDTGAEYGSREWVARFGFGISTLMLPQDAVGPYLQGHDHEISLNADPNREYVKSLDEEALDAYQIALTGSPIRSVVVEEDPDIEAGAEPASFSDGCVGKAYATSGQVDDFFFEFSDQLQEITDRVANHPDFIEAIEEITSCMANDGFTYLPISERFTGAPWQERLNELSNNYNVLDSPGQVEIKLTEEHKLQLRSIQDEEIELALSTFDCGGSDLAVRTLQSRLSVEYEREFIDKYADELEPHRLSG